MGVFKRLAASVEERRSGSSKQKTLEVSQREFASESAPSRLLALPDELLVLIICELLPKEVIDVSHVCKICHLRSP